MTVRELIASLSTCTNQDAIVILQKDAEGNGFSPLRNVADNDPAVVEAYKAETTWCGEVYEPAFAPDGAVPCVCLVPIN